jgi:hypothetical protein
MTKTSDDLKKKSFGERITIRAVVVLIWFTIWTYVGLHDAPYYVVLGIVMLALPLYWQVYLKRDFLTAQR